MSKPIPEKTRKAVHARSGGVCEGCHLRPAVQIHHRRYVSRGGSNDLINLLDLCGLGNAAGCHGIAHTATGERLGWSVRSGIDPSTVPVTPLVITEIR